MKKLYIYILLLAFAVKPVYNVAYLVYYQLNIEFITEVFCENKEKVELSCNGKCFLAKQLQTDTSSQDDEKALRISSEIFSLVFFEKSSHLDLFKTVLQLDKKISKRYIKNYAYTFDYEYFRPPIS